MKSELRKLVKDGEVKFYEGKREENKAKAYKLLAEVEENGYQDYSVYSNSFGYIVKL